MLGIGLPTKENPRNNRVSKQLPFILDIADGEEVKLLLTIAACGVDGQNNWPNNEATGDANIAQHFKVTKEEKAV